jgi:hypothetical protein
MVLDKERRDDDDVVVEKPMAVGAATAKDSAVREIFILLE